MESANPEVHAGIGAAGDDPDPGVLKHMRSGSNSEILFELSVTATCESGKDPV